MNITVEYVQGEEREGFYIQPLMKRIWAVQLDILKVIDTICKRHNIKYVGWFGTLLGAVRHHGFIPWDDDIDLAMLREDYERFLYISESELPKGWKIFRVGPMLTRVLNTDVINLSQDFLNKSHGCPFVMGIDIFCLDNIPPNEEEAELWVNMYWAAVNLYVHWDAFAKDSQWKDTKWDQLKELESLTGYHFDRSKDIKEQLYTLSDKVGAMYWDVEPDEVTKASSFYRSRKYRIPRSDFDKIIEVPFEDTRLPILENYDLPCRLDYGNDYMTPVKWPVHKDIDAQINVLRQYFEKQNMTLPEFFDMDSDSDD